MKEKMKIISERFHKYNAENMAFLAFGLDKDTVYDLLVVAPAYTPYKLKMDRYCQVTTLKEGAYIGGYLVEKDGLTIAWVKTSSGDGNVIDHMSVCCELQFKSIVFIGAVGALKPEFGLGDICTPTYSIAGGIAHTYLKDDMRDYVPFERIEPDMNYVEKIIALANGEGYEIKKGSVFCTPSVALEYYHLDEIQEFDTDLIEMETAAFYCIADLMEKPAVALLVVSDNSATGVALVGRTEEEETRYDESRKVVLPRLILRIAKEEN